MTATGEATSVSYTIAPSIVHTQNIHRCFNPLKGFVEATDSSSFLTPLSLNTFGENATHVDGFSDGRDAFGCVKSSRENTCAQSVLSLFFAPPCSETFSLSIPLGTTKNEPHGEKLGRLKNEGKLSS